MKQGFYAVARGRVPGVYRTWPDCEKQVKGFQRARYKKFDNKAEALAFIEQHKDANASLSTNAVTFTSEVDSTPGPSNRKRLAVNGSESIIASKKFKSYSSSGNVKKVSAEKWVAEGVPIVYTDGSCMGNGMRRCKAGFGVFWGDGHPDNVSEPLTEGPPTNNRAELMAVICALKQAQEKGYKRLVVRTDSNLLIQSMNVWINSWRRNGWKTSNGTDVKNKDLLVNLDTQLKKVEVCFEHVRGHVGVYGNEKADELARGGAERYKHG